MKAQPLHAPGYVLDESRWPLLVVTVNGHPTPGQETEFLLHMTQIVSRRKIFGVLFDVRAAGKPGDAPPGLDIGEWMEEHSSELSTWCKAYAVLLPNSAWGAMISTMHWMGHSPARTHPFTNAAKAEAWVLDRLGKT